VFVTRLVLPICKTIEFNQALGNKLLIVFGVSPKMTETQQGWQEVAKIFDESAEKVKPHGMRVRYLNHTIEFQQLESKLPRDTFFGKTRKEVVMQLDIGNALEVDADPVVFLKK
jgi:sugar phosphate isomerase/epimerase